MLNRLKSIWNSLKYNTHDCYDKCTWECNQGRNCTCDISFAPAMIAVHELFSKVPDVDIGNELLQIEQRIAQLGNIYYERKYGDATQQKDETQH